MAIWRKAKAANVSMAANGEKGSMKAASESVMQHGNGWRQ